MGETIYLYDEDGNEIPFEFLDTVNYHKNEYVCLRPMEGSSSDEVLILLVEGDELAIVENTATMQAVYKEFQKKHSELEFRD